MSAIKQKEYLKKYLSIGKDKTEKKKKKKKNESNNVASRLTIIDDNADTFENAVKEDLLEDEYAPQIVAVIDDRPPSLQIDEKSKTNLWIPIGGNNDNSTEPSSSKNAGDLSPPRFKIKSATRREDVTLSPPRRKHSPKKHNSEKKINNEGLKIESDVSPPRKKHSSTKHNLNKKIDDARKKVGSDVSPPRKDTEFTPPRIANKKKSSRWETEDRDLSAPKQQVFDELVGHEDGNNMKYNDDDFSPPRQRSKTPSETSHKKKSSRWESKNILETPSIHIKDTKKEEKDEKLAKKYSDDDTSPPRKRSKTTPPKMVKTLDGKTAGLQNAKQLAAESTLIKEKEMELFNKMSSEISGANASTIVRDRKTGRVRNLQEEAAREVEKKKKENVNKEKYSRWGRGLKQVEDATKKREEDLNEMSKPLARYANDEDLERYLKEQEREGDPMLAYIRKKKKKKDVDEGKSIRPEYMGEFMPNRFGIRPGHRWDGVDRSNGYEKKWFEIQNSRMAQQEEAYKWSTEDM